MKMVTPKYALLDTFVINECARCPEAALTAELRQLVADGYVVPFITEHQMEEIAQHGDDEVFLSRVRFLGSLAHIASCGDSVYGTGLGSILDLREHEIRFLLNNPTASLDDVVSAIGPTIRDGFQTGPEFVSRAKDGLYEFRKGLHRHSVSQAAEIASMDHFPLVDNNTPFVLDPEGSAPTTYTEDLAQWLEGQKRQLVTLINQFGDNRVSDPEALVEREFSDYVATAQRLAHDPRGFLRALCANFGIEPERLPKKPSIEDAGNEAIFVANLRLHGRRIGVSHDDLFSRIRKEQLPSWIIWEGLLRRMRSAENTRGSNLNDRFLACFGPYVEVLQVDKRTKDFLRQLAQSGPQQYRQLFEQVYRKVPQKNGLAGLVDAVRQV